MSPIYNSRLTPTYFIVDEYWRVIDAFELILSPSEFPCSDGDSVIETQKSSCHDREQRERLYE